MSRDDSSHLPTPGTEAPARGAHTPRPTASATPGIAPRCNTHPSDTGVTERPLCSVVELGVDTWRLTWPVRDERALREQCRYATGYGYKARRTICGYSLGWHPGSAMAWVEGHPAPGGRLAPPASLDAWCGAIDLIMAGSDIQLSSPIAIARMDIAATVEFQDPCCGRAVLDGLGSLRMPRCKPEVHGFPTETVYFKGLRGRRKLCRVYDFGVSRGHAERGRFLRFEEEAIYQAGRRLHVGEMTPRLVKERFERRFAPLLTSGRRIAVLPPDRLETELIARVRDGSMTALAAERIAGFVALDRAGGCGHDVRTLYRRRRELAASGIVSGPYGSQPITFDLDSIFDCILSSDLWG